MRVSIGSYRHKVHRHEWRSNLTKHAQESRIDVVDVEEKAIACLVLFSFASWSSIDVH